MSDAGWAVGWGSIVSWGVAAEAECTAVAADGTQTRTELGSSGLFFPDTVTEDASLPVVDVGFPATTIQNDNAGTFSVAVHLDLTVTGGSTVDVIVFWAASGDFDPFVEIGRTTQAIAAGSESIDFSDTYAAAESGIFYVVLENATIDPYTATIESTSTFSVCAS